jgi:LacI family transcriptional regulator
MQTKSEQFATQLKQNILNVGPGTKLPSVRQLAYKSKVSHLTVIRAMNILEAEGYIVRNSTVGIYSARPGQEKISELKKKRILLAAPNYPSPILDLLLGHLQERIIRRMNVPLVVRYDYSERIDRLRFREKFDGLILMLCTSPFEIEHLYRLKKLSVPIVILNQLLSGLNVDCVEYNQEMTGALAADHLIKLGHRRLAILISEPRVRNVEARCNSFVHQAKMAGIEDVQVFDCGTRNGEFSSGRAYEEFSGIIKQSHYPSRRLDFTGLFVVSDGSAMGVLKACYDANLKIPGELSVIGADKYPGSELFCPALSTIDPNYPQLAEDAVSIVHQRLNGDDQASIQRLITPSLVVRESTGPAPA